MAINVTAANHQASELDGKANQLRSARNKLAASRDGLGANWQGREVPLILESINEEIARIDSLLRQLGEISSDIRGAAEEIRREEEAAAAAAAARAARQRARTEARNAYNQACDALDTVAKERNEIAQQMRNTKSFFTMISLNEKLREIDQRLAEAQAECDRCRLVLDAAGR